MMHSTDALCSKVVAPPTIHGLAMRVLSDAYLAKGENEVGRGYASCVSRAFVFFLLLLFCALSSSISKRSHDLFLKPLLEQLLRVSTTRRPRRRCRRVSHCASRTTVGRGCLRS